MRILPLFVLLALSIPSCKSSSSGDPAFQKTEEDPKPAISPTRSSVSKEPAQQYVEKLTGDWEYKLELFETKETFSYLLKLKYQEFTAEDTIRFPDFGILPQPVLKKAEEGEHVVLLGFLDKKGAFREYKQITATNDKMSVKTTKYYTVSKYATPVN